MADTEPLKPGNTGWLIADVVSNTFTFGWARTVVNPALLWHFWLTHSGSPMWCFRVCMLRNRGWLPKCKHRHNATPRLHNKQHTAHSQSACCLYC